MKVFISTFPFSRNDASPIELLKSSGHEYVVNPKGRKLTADEILELASDCDGIVAGTEDLTKLIDQSKKLKIISRVGIGLDSVPMDKCSEKDVVVAYTPDAVTDAVVELTIGMMISGLRKVLHADKDLREGGWTRYYGKRIGGSVVGVVGAGRIGLKVVKNLATLGPREILVSDLKDRSGELNKISKLLNVEIREVSKEELIKNSDIISLHVPLDANTKNYLSKDDFNYLKEDVLLVNTARGGIINEEDLNNFLINNKNAFACMDVFEIEPYKGELLKLENVLLTQHMGSCSYDCRARMEWEATKSVLNFFNGESIIADAFEDGK